jgi:hypothetical protein
MKKLRQVPFSAPYPSCSSVFALRSRADQWRGSAKTAWSSRVAAHINHLTALVGDRCRLARAEKATLRILDVSGIIQGQ